MAGLTTTVPPGTIAPAFSLPAADGRLVGIADFRGRADVVLVFLRGRH